MSSQKKELKAARLHNRTHLFVQAPHNVLKDVIVKQPDISLNDISHLAQTCVRFRSLFQPVVDRAGIKKLLQHIAYGEQAEAEKMIAASPHLLMMSADVVDYSHRKIINVTPAQLAFGGDDEQMCAMLKEKLGEGEFAKQISEKFIEDAEIEQDALDEFDLMMNQLVAEISDPNANILDELNHVPNESPLRNLLDNFRVIFSPGEVRAGKHFDTRFLVKALEIFDTNYKQWGINKSLLFVNQVIGYLERLLPVSYVQAVCQGLCYVINQAPLKRVLTLTDGSLYFPLDAYPENRLGFNHGIYLFEIVRSHPGVLLFTSDATRVFEFFAKQKTQACRALLPDQGEKIRRCVMM